MRTIKFRAINVHTNKFVYGDLVLNKPAGAYRIVEDFALVCNPVKHNGAELVGCSGLFRNIKSETVGEFIGLKDKNNKEIFEGDAVHGYYSINNSPHYIGNNQREREAKGIVIFDEGCFKIENTLKKKGGNWKYTQFHKFFDNLNGTKDIEIIGNIYENPELLK